MANILKTTYTYTGFKPNSPLKSTTVTIDSDIPISDVNLYLVNNGERYDHETEFVTSGSSATLITPLRTYYLIFFAEMGDVSSKTGWQTGRWFVQANVPHLT